MQPLPTPKVHHRRAFVRYSCGRLGPCLWRHENGCQVFMHLCKRTRLFLSSVHFPSCPSPLLHRWDDGIRLIKLFDYSKALHFFTGLDDKVRGALPASLVAHMGSASKYWGSFWLICHILYMQGPSADFARLGYLFSSLKASLLFLDLPFTRIFCFL